MAGYSQTTLAKKLGIKEGFTVKVNVVLMKGFMSDLNYQQL